LGKSGKLTELIKKIKDVPAEKRGQVGVSINEAKNTLFTALAERKNKWGETPRLGLI